MLEAMVLLKKNARYRPTVEQVCKEFLRRRAETKTKAAAASASSPSSSSSNASKPDEPMELPDFDDAGDSSDEALSQEQVDGLLRELREDVASEDESADDFEAFMASLTELDMTGFLDDM